MDVVGFFNTEIPAFLLALQFLTRLKFAAPFTPESMRQSPRWYPGVGVVVGGDAELRQEFVDGGEIPRSHVFTVAVRGIWGIATYYGCVRAGKTLQLKIRGVAQPGRAPGSGPGGRRFESSRPDQYYQ